MKLKFKLKLNVLIKALSIITSINQGYLTTSLPAQIIEQYIIFTKGLKITYLSLSLVQVSLMLGYSIGLSIANVFVRHLGYPKAIRLLFAFQTFAVALQLVPIHWSYLVMIRFLVGFFGSPIQQITPLLAADVLTEQVYQQTIGLSQIMFSGGILLSFLIHYCISFNYKLWPLMNVFPILLSITGIAVTQIVMVVIKRQHERHMRSKRTAESNGEFSNNSENLLQLNIDIDKDYIFHPEKFIEDDSDDEDNDIELKQKSFANLLKGQDQQINYPETINEEEISLDGQSVQQSHMFLKQLEQNIQNTQRPIKRLTKRQLAKLKFIICSLSISQAFTAYEAIMIHSSQIFYSIFNLQKGPIYSCIIIGIVSIISDIFISNVTKQFKRIPLITSSFTIIAILYTLGGLIYFLKQDGDLIITIITSSIVFIKIGIQPLIQIYLDELFPEAYKDVLHQTQMICYNTAKTIAILLFIIPYEKNAYITYFTYSIIVFVFGIMGVSISFETHQLSKLSVEQRIKQWLKKWKQKQQQSTQTLSNVPSENKLQRMRAQSQHTVSKQKQNPIKYNQSSDKIKNMSVYCKPSMLGKSRIIVENEKITLVNNSFDDSA